MNDYIALYDVLHVALLEHLQVTGSFQVFARYLFFEIIILTDPPE
jgi:hypothetical protein